MGILSVSSKELFVYEDDKTLLIVNIDAPKGGLNIQQNSNVCVSFIDIFRQQSFKLVG